MRRDSHEINRASWNAATAAHNSHKGDQAAYFREGGDTLCEEELELLGDLTGKAVLHLQCNAGQDSLSLARRGARVTGVDISDEAIRFARELARESGIAAEFERADVYDWLDGAAAGKRQFDIVFCSYGALCWLSDLGAWARGIANVLRPGGRFVTVEFHPVAMMFDPAMKLTGSYFGHGRPVVWNDGVSDYVAASGKGLALGEYQEGVSDFKNPHSVHEFQWAISEILTSLLDAGLRIEHFREYPYTNGCKFYDDSKMDEKRRWRLAPAFPELPQMFALAARKS